MNRYILSVLVENKFGILSRVSGLFSARGFNIDSLSVGETQDPCISRMTVVVKGDKAVVIQIQKQLCKLVDIIKVVCYQDCYNTYIERELLLLKLTIAPSQRIDFFQISQLFGFKILDMMDSIVLVEIVADCFKVNALMDSLSAYKIIDMARTGTVAIGRDSANTLDKTYQKEGV